MKFKSLLFVVSFIPAVVMSQAPVISPPMVETDKPGPILQDVQPAAAPVAVKPAPAPAKPAATAPPAKPAAAVFMRGHGRVDLSN